MIGYYNIYLDGKLVDVAMNNITDGGRRVLLRYLTGQVGRFVGAIAVGTSSVPSTRYDSKLGFEFGRAAVNLSTPDFINGKLIFKSTIDPALSGYIYEIGLYPFLQEPSSNYNSRLLTGFESSLETITGATPATNNFRIGQDSSQVTTTASATSTIVLPGTPRDFSGFGMNDTFTLAYFINDTNVASIKINMVTTPGNYFQYTLTPGAVAGYYATDIIKNNFVSVGQSNWADINSMEFQVVSKSTGTSVVQLDGFRINDNNDYPDYALISRAVVPVPRYKAPGQQLDIEYVLEMNA